MTRINRPSRATVVGFVASALAFLADDAGRLDRFLATTGFQVTDLRSAATMPGFAESLLDYLCSDETLLLAYAADSGQDPTAIEAFRQSFAPASFES